VANLGKTTRTVLGCVLTLGLIVGLSVAPESASGVDKLAAFPSPSVLSFVLFGIGAVLLRGVIGPQSTDDSES